MLRRSFIQLMKTSTMPSLTKQFGGFSRPRTVGALTTNLALMKKSASSTSDSPVSPKEPNSSKKLHQSDDSSFFAKGMQTLQRKIDVIDKQIASVLESLSKPDLDGATTAFLRSEVQQLRSEKQALLDQMTDQMKKDVRHIGLDDGFIGDSVLDEIANHPDFLSHRHSPVFDSNRAAIPKYVDRNESISTMFDLFGTHLNKITSPHNEHANMLRPVLNATSGAPGIGKTRFVDELQDKAALTKYAAEFIPKHKHLFESDNVLTLNISFFSETSTLEEEATAPGNLMAIARLLYRYFGPKFIGLSPSARYSQFWNRLLLFREFHNMSIESCLELILHHHASTQRRIDKSKPGILILGVDELLKMRFVTFNDVQDLAESKRENTSTVNPELFSKVARKLSDITELIRQLGFLMDRYLHVDGRPYVIMPVITSLSQILVGNTATPTGRQVGWIPLSPLKEAHHQVCSVLDIHKNALVERQTIQVLCQYLGGHGRLIENLVELLQSNRGLRESLKNGISSVPSIIDVLRTRPAVFAYKIPDHLAEGIIACAVRGDSIELSANPVGSSQSVDHLILNGIYLGKSDFSSSKVQPYLSLFQLYWWAFDCREHSNKLAQVILAMVQPQQLYSFSFLEHFHMCFEYMRRLTDQFTHQPDVMHRRLGECKDPDAVFSLISNSIRFQQLTERVDLNTLTDGRTKKHIRGSRHDNFYGSFSMIPPIVPSAQIRDSFVSDRNLASVVSLSFERQPLFDGHADTRFQLKGRLDGVVYNVRDFFRFKFRESTVANEAHLNSWVKTDVIPFMKGVKDKDPHSVHRFFYISTGIIPEATQRSVKALCDKNNIRLHIFDETKLPQLYGPTLMHHPGFMRLTNLADLKASALPTNEANVPKASTKPRKFNRKKGYEPRAV